MKMNLQLMGGRGGGSGLSGGSAGGGAGIADFNPTVKDKTTFEIEAYPSGTATMKGYVDDVNGIGYTQRGNGVWEAYDLETGRMITSTPTSAGFTAIKNLTAQQNNARAGFVSRENQPADIRQSIAQMQVKRETSPRGVSKATRNEIGSRLDGATSTGDTLAIKGRESSVYYTKVGKNKWSFGSGEGGTPHDSGYILENLSMMGGEIVYKKKK